MKHYDVFDNKGDWIGTEVFDDDFPDSLVLTTLRTKMTYSPDVWCLPTDLADAGIFPARIEHHSSGKEGQCCSFCGKHKDDVPSLVGSAVQPSTAICGGCISKLKGRRRNG